MTISHAASTGVSTTTGARGTTSTSVAYVGVSAGRMGVLTATTKPSTATLPATVTDGGGRVWDRLIEITGGTGTNAADTGTSRIAKYVRIFDGTETGNVTVTASNTPSQVCGAMDVYSTTAGGWHTPIGVTGADTTHGTNPTATSGTWATALAAGDWVNVGYGTDTDDSTAASGHAITQSGTTFGTVTARSRVGNSDGNDGSVFTWDAPVNSGGATSALTMSMTWAANSCGAFAAVLLREATTTALTKTTVDTFTGTTIDTGNWDPWGGAQITQNNQIQLSTTTTAGGYYGIGRLAAVDLASVYPTIRLVNIGNQALASYGAYLFNVQFSTDNEAYWVSYANTLSFNTKVAGTTTQRITMPTLPAMQRHFAIGIVSGNLTAFWSFDGSNWVTAFSMANPFSGDTTGFAYLMVGTDSAEASTTRLDLDDYGTLSPLTEVTKSYELQWTVQQTVTKSYTLPWTTQQTIAKSVELDWTVLNTATRSYELDWVVRALITRSYELDWHTQQTITASYTLPWTTRQMVTRSYELDWTTRTAVTRSYELDWTVRAAVVRSYELDWVVRTVVTRSYELDWHVRQTIVSSTQLEWVVRTAIARSYELDWTVRQTITRGYELDWVVQVTASRSYELSWTVRAVVLRSYELRWDVESTLTQVTKTYELPWLTQQTIVQSVQLPWTVRQPVSRSYELDWLVRVAVLRSYELPWTTRVAVLRSYELLWTSSARVLRSYELRWDVESDASPTPLPADVVASLGDAVTAYIGGDVVRSYL